MNNLFKLFNTHLYSTELLSLFTTLIENKLTLQIKQSSHFRPLCNTRCYHQSIHSMFLESHYGKILQMNQQVQWTLC